MSSTDTVPRPWSSGDPLARAGHWLRGALASAALPLAGALCFLLLWQVAAARVQTSLGVFPGPAATWEQAANLWREHRSERERADAFMERQRARIAERERAEPGYRAVLRPYTGKPTFIDQIGTSLLTVMCGFLLASLLAIPAGIALGLSAGLHAAVNPVIQLFRPVSPLAWLPLVTMVVSALYVTPDPGVPKSFLTSMITVTLCCLWPTMINTTLGVTAVSADLVNVSRVLRLGWFAHVRHIVVPGAVPMIFTGLRLSLGIAWMVLIAAEMLAQNPGLGKFVWDEFQNGSSASLGRILVAVLTIGLIGAALDRAMLLVQRTASWDTDKTSR